MKIRAILAVLFGCLAGFPAYADFDGYGPSLYVASGVLAEATAEDGVKAKTKAHETALRDAVIGVMRELTLARDHGRLDKIVGASAAGYVDEYDVVRESPQPRSYRAMLNIALNKAAIHRALKAAGTPFTDHRAPPFLIIPVLVRDGRIDWDAADWRQSWGPQTNKEGLLQISIFNASKEDRVYFDSQPPWLSPTASQIMALRYDAEFALLAAAEQMEDGSVFVTLSGVDAIGPFRLTQRYGDLRGVSTPDLQTIAGYAVADLADRWKSAVLGLAVRPSHFTVARAQPKQQTTLLEADLVADQAGRKPEVAAILGRLSAIEAVTEIVVRDDGGISLRYRGNSRSAQTDLAAHGLSLVRTHDRWWLATY